MRGHGPSSNALRAALTARCVSSRPARATRAQGASVAGLIESMLFPDAAAQNCPSMYNWYSCMALPPCGTVVSCPTGYSRSAAESTLVDTPLRRAPPPALVERHLAEEIRQVLRIGSKGQRLSFPHLLDALAGRELRGWRS